MSRILPLAAALLLLCGHRAAAQTPAPADTAEVQRVVAAAREAAHHDRNAESAALFERALALDPGRRGELLREYADQLAYSGRAPEAVPLFREVLAAPRSPEEARWARLGLALALSWSGRHAESLREYEALAAADPRDAEARLGRARVLSWMDRLGPARAEYEAVLRLNPAEPEARRGLARVQAWRGRHRDAQRRLAAFLREHPGDAEAALLLAQAQHWMGRPDRATRTLAGLLERHPAHAEGTRLLAELRRGAAPSSGVRHQESEQSDRLSIRQEEAWQRFHPGRGRSTVELRYQAQGYAPGSGAGSRVGVRRPGAHLRHRISDGSEWTATLHADRIGPAGGAERTVLTYDTYLTLWPSDLLRLDLGTSRTTFDNVRSLERGISATYGTLSVDVVPDERTRFTARSSLGRYTDGNGRRWGELETERRVWNRPRLHLGARLTAFEFSRRLDHGYFNPRRHLAGVATARAYGPLLGGLRYDLDGSYGRESSTPGGAKPLWSAGAGAVYRLADRVEMEARYGYFSSLQASSGGFARRTASLGVRYLW